MVLPFPFDAVEDFFRDLFNQIARSISDIVSDVVKTIAPILNDIKNFIESSISSLQQAFFNQLQFLKNEILGILTGLPAAVANLFGGLQSALAPLVNSLKLTIQGLFSNLLQSINTTIIPFLDEIARGLQTVTNSVLTKINQAITPFLSAINSNINSLSAQIASIPQSTFNQLSNFSTFIQTSVNQIPLLLKPALDQINGFTQATHTAVQDMRVGLAQFSSNVQNQLGQIPQAFASGFDFFLKSIVNAGEGIKTQLIDPIMESLTTLPEALRHITRPTGSITPEAAKGELDQAGLIMVGAYGGVNAASALLEIFTAGQVDQIIRGIIDTMDDIGLSVFAKDYVTFDYETGVKPALTREVLKRFTPMIPGAGDLVNMVVKEAFVDVLRTPAPDIFAKFMAEQGFDEFWSTTFWTAHWVPIDLGSITTMFHRGIITEEDFIRRLIILDFRPDDTEIVKELTFKLPNRIEARLMARFGLLSDQQLDEIIKGAGVREDFVEPLRTMMQDFNLTNIFTRTEARAISSYEDGLINSSQFAQILVDVKRPPNVVNADIQLGNFKRLMDFKQTQLKSITKALKRGSIDAGRATSELQSIGIDSEVIDFTIANAQFELDLGTTAKVKSAAPKLTASQLSKAVKKGLIEPEEALSTLEAKGFDAEEAVLLLQIAEALPA